MADQPLSEHEPCPDDLLAEQEVAFARDIARLHARVYMVDVACPTCGTDVRVPVFEKFGFSFQRCPECRTIYMSPRPSEAAMADYYANSENYAYWAKHIFPATEATRREKIHRPWLDRAIGYAEFVREAALKGEIRLDPYLHRVLVEEMGAARPTFPDIPHRTGTILPHVARGPAS